MRLSCNEFYYIELPCLDFLYILINIQANSTCKGSVKCPVPSQGAQCPPSTTTTHPYILCIWSEISITLYNLIVSFFSGVCKTLPVRYIHQCHLPRSLTDRKAWPRENQTRVAESAPLGNCGFWEGSTTTLSPNK